MSNEKEVKTTEQILMEQLNRTAVRQFDRLALETTVRRLDASGIKSRVVSFGVPSRTNDPFKPAKAKINKAVSYSGVVSSGSRWAKEACPGWIIENLGTGLFKVIHNIGDFKYSINVSLLGKNGTITVEGSDEDSFIVSIKDNENNYQDLDFIFSLSMTTPPT